ncbi:MAG: Rv1355c family protein [Bacteroidia bacterium]
MALFTDIITHTANSTTYKPLFFRVYKNSDYQKLKILLVKHPEIRISDEIQGQLEELIKLQNPSKTLSEFQKKKLVKKHIGKIKLDNYGVWIYYPWLNTLVHSLDEKEFIQVRTNRNQYKITPEEQKVLSKKIIGVVGLSVGKAIATTIAMERICGEIRLADFDVIELSNLNRIQAGLPDFNLKKVIVVAREIAEIDPFLKVTVFPDGLTEKNVKDFFTKNGKLNICVEVCDGLYAKIFSRQYAKKYKVAVVMNSSDRGTTDIERYDIDPNYPLMHGLIDHLDLNKAKEAKTNEEKVPYLLPMLGIDTCTTRLKASMLEIQQTITTWPQLASGVILGGGISTDVCRRILLGNLRKSGRYIVDLDDVINEDNSIDLKKKNESFDIVKAKGLKVKLSQTDSNKSVLSTKQIKEIVKHACLAPSGGNCQPWKWILKNGYLYLIYDNYSINPVLNYKDAASYIAIGAALENLAVYCDDNYIKPTLKYFPSREDKNIIARISFERTDIKGKKSQLNKYISKRFTNRTINQVIPLNNNFEKKLSKNIPSIFDEANLLYNNKTNYQELKFLLSEIDRIYISNPFSHEHFVKEFCWSEAENNARNDGIDVNTLPLTPTESVGFNVAKNKDVIKLIDDWNLGSAFGKMSKNAINNSSCFILFKASSLDKQEIIQKGRLIQNFWLEITRESISAQPMSINTFLHLYLTGNNFKNFEKHTAELIDIRKRLNKLFKLKKNEIPLFLMRVFKTKDNEMTKRKRYKIDNIFLDYSKAKRKNI